MPDKNGLSALLCGITASQHTSKVRSPTLSTFKRCLSTDLWNFNPQIENSVNHFEAPGGSYIYRQTGNMESMHQCDHSADRMFH